MNVYQKLLESAQELSNIADSIKTDQSENILLQEIILGQALHGIRLNIARTIKEIQRAVTIAEFDAE